MLRVLYRLVLRAHPPYFRQRFAEEMQCIFDHADSGVAAAGLLLLPDEHAATVRAVAHAAASAAMEPLLRPIFRMVLLLVVEMRD